MTTTDQVATRQRWRWRRIIVGAILTSVLLTLLLAGWLHLRLRASLPLLDGVVVVRGIHEAVLAERDAMGVPTISAASRHDAAFALGFLHAQDRFFQMDLLRRLSSGRLSELFGEAALPSDQEMRKHRFQRTAKRVLESVPALHRDALAAYTSGVNQGLQELHDVPFEYLVLRTTPSPWTQEDSLYVVMSMLCDLQGWNAKSEIRLGMLRERVPEEVFAFLVRAGSEWDATLDGSVWETPRVPSADVWSLRQEREPEQDNLSLACPSDVTHPWLAGRMQPQFHVGSNNWVVSSAHSKSDQAMLASDMHLGLSVPTTWYRAVIDAPTVDGQRRKLVGVTLPGACPLVAGSNGEIAWSFTNSSGDFGEIIELQQTSPTSLEYQTPDGPRQLEQVVEWIKVGENQQQKVEYEWSIWGPVIHVRDGRRFVHRWVGHDPEAFNLGLLDLESASAVDAALDVANRTGIPHQNMVVADTGGNIGWTICGRLPRRQTAPSVTPVDWSQPGQSWDGYLAADEYPRIVNPSSGRLWSANNRILGGHGLRLIGDGRYDPGARASRIRDLLMAADTFTERDMLAIQLDDTATLMRRWHVLLLDTVTGADDVVSPQFVAELKNWGEHAAVDSVGYRIVHEFRLQVHDRLFGVATPWRELEQPGAFAARTGIHDSLAISDEDVVWQLINSGPQHWLPKDYGDWNELLRDAARATESTLSASRPLQQATWGEKNTVRIQHPLSSVLAFVSPWLDMPIAPLPGDDHMPRVQATSFGASQRMVVSPGHESEGIYHQPGGQCGHPYSQFYRAGFDDWAQGRPSPLLPGPTKHRLRLEPPPEA